MNEARATERVPAHSAGLGEYRWVICALLFLATTVNYIDRQILALLKPLLDGELHWTNEQFGQVNAAFQLAYAVGLLLFGAFVDRFGPKLGYGLSLLAWSLAAVAHAAVGSVGGFAMARVALGLGEGGNFPSAIKVVALWFPRGERALATALFNSGANVGAVIAPLVVPAIAFSWGWRSTFVVAGLAGLLWLFLWVTFYDAPERATRLGTAERAYIRGDAEEGQAQLAVGWRVLLARRETWAFIVAKFLTDPVWWFFLIWLPDFFKKSRGLDLKSSWLPLASIYLIVTVLSVAGGWLTGHLVRQGQSVSQARKRGLLLFACLALPIVLVTRAGDWGAVALIGLAGAAHQAWSANLYTSASDIFPKSAVASVVGLGGMAGSLGGVLFPLWTGWLLDRFEARGEVTAAYAILFTVCGSAYLLAFGLNHLLAPRFEPITLSPTVELPGARP
jgi:ACS family hexuronate transporter-like MFS transporter